MFRSLAAVVLSPLLAIALPAQEKRPDFDAQARASAQRCLERSGAQGLALAVRSGGSGTLTLALGSLEPEAGRLQARIDARALVEPLVAIAAWQQIERGTWRASQQMRELARACGLTESDATLEQFLAQTAGLASLADAVLADAAAAALPTAEFVARAAGLPRRAEPEACVEYSDAHTLAVAVALGAATGDARAWIGEHVLARVGLDADRIAAAAPAARAIGWQRAGGSDYESYAATALGPLDFRLSIDELAQLCDGFTDADVLAPPTWRRMCAPARERDAQSTSYAHGLTLAPQGEFDGYLVGGAVGDTRVHAALYPGAQLAIAIALVGPGAEDGTAAAECERELARQLLGLDEPVRVALPLPAEQRSTYVGFYELGCRTYRIVERGNDLEYVPPRGEPVLLVHYGEHRFAATDDPGLRISFTVAEGRPADELRIDDHGVRTVATRLF
ncbi:MAG: hypothetical protein FJ299_05795 [Planctomycetes bacterium]|nr:hypothetical protein [Planctomycetota bacterium]